MCTWAIAWMVVKSKDELVSLIALLLGVIAIIGDIVIFTTLIEAL